MKICYVVLAHPQYLCGGAEVMCANLAQELHNQGVIASMTNGDFGQPSFETIDNVPVYKIQSRWRDSFILFQPFSFLKSKFDIYSVFKKIDADIYHQICGGTLSFYSHLAARKLGKKSVYTAASTADCYSRHFIYDKTLPYFDARIVVSQDMQQMMKNSFGLDSTVLYNAYPLPKKKSIEDKDNTVIWVGKFDKNKKPEEFVKLAKHLAHTDLQCILIAQKKDVPLYHQIIAEAKNIPNLTILDNVVCGQENIYFEKAKFLVSTSLLEGFPITFIQAWLNSTPTFTQFIDPDKQITKHHLGEVIPDLEQLAQEICRYHDDDALWRETSQNARNYAENHHNIEKSAKEHIELYKKVLEQ